MVTWLIERFNTTKPEREVEGALRYFLAVLRNKNIIQSGFKEIDVFPEGGPPVPVIQPFSRYGEQVLPEKPVLPEERPVLLKPQFFEWSQQQPNQPQFKLYLEHFCQSKRFPEAAAWTLLGADGRKVVADYASPRQAAVALFRNVGGDENVWRDFLVKVGLARLAGS